MSTEQLQALPSVEDDVPSALVPLSALVLLLWKRRLLIVLAFFVGLVATFLVSLLFSNMYESVASLMPPDAQSLSTQSTLTALTGAPNISLGGASLASQRTAGSTTIGIMMSRTVQDDIIDHFNLIQAYRVRDRTKAREALIAHTLFEEDRKSGIVKITVTDKDKVRARDIAQAYVDELDKLLNTLSSSSARREREFLEGRLKSLKVDLDNSSEALSKFSSKNATLNPQVQGQALFESAAKLQEALATAQADLSGLRSTYSDDNVRVRSARARVDELEVQLQKMGGAPSQSSGAESPGQFYPSIRELPLLGLTYTELLRDTTIQQSLYETLTKQYEIAKVDEAKELPVAKELDKPVVAETHSSPHRVVISIIGSILAAFFTIIFLVLKDYWEGLEELHGLKKFMSQLRKS